MRHKAPHDLRHLGRHKAPPIGQLDPRHGHGVARPVLGAGDGAHIRGRCRQVRSRGLQHPRFAAGPPRRPVGGQQLRGLIGQDPAQAGGLVRCKGQVGLAIAHQGQEDEAWGPWAAKLARQGQQDAGGHAHLRLDRTQRGLPGRLTGPGRGRGKGPALAGAGLLAQQKTAPAVHHHRAKGAGPGMGPLLGPGQALMAVALGLGPIVVHAVQGVPDLAVALGPRGAMAERHRVLEVGIGEVHDDPRHGLDQRHMRAARTPGIVGALVRHRLGERLKIKAAQAQQVPARPTAYRQLVVALFLHHTEKPKCCEQPHGGPSLETMRPW